MKLNEEKNTVSETAKRKLRALANRSRTVFNIKLDENKNKFLELVNEIGLYGIFELTKNKISEEMPYTEFVFNQIELLHNKSKEEKLLLKELSELTIQTYCSPSSFRKPMHFIHAFRGVITENTNDNTAKLITELNVFLNAMEASIGGIPAFKEDLLTGIVSEVTDGYFKPPHIMQSDVADFADCPFTKQSNSTNLTEYIRTGLNAEEPPPVENNSTPIWELVVKDMQERDLAGRAKYGTPLQANNGRKPLNDLYQELMDAVVYIRQEIEQRDMKFIKVGAIEICDKCQAQCDKDDWFYMPCPNHYQAEYNNLNLNAAGLTDSVMKVNRTDKEFT